MYVSWESLNFQTDLIVVQFCRNRSPHHGLGTKLSQNSFGSFVMRI
ncbi:hypothetical protein LEP1GSC175_2408 [Leptospira santarosai str. HAI821]|nr:hypothetical protein LEP1GSC175_2408 [Leptospira santarosai str. HAI821]